VTAGAERPDGLLVVAERVPRRADDPRERLLWELLLALRALWPELPVTLLAPQDLPAAAPARDLEARGVEVLAGPRDWTSELRSRPAGWSTVLLAGDRAEHRFAAVLDQELPAAMRVLLLAEVPLRSVASLEPVLGRRDEVRGLHGLTGLVRERAAVSVERVDAVWCLTEQDRDYVVGTFPHRRCTLLADPALDAGVAPVPLAERSGLVVVAGPGSDAFAAHEDVALAAADDVLPTLRRRVPALRLHVLSDRPSPQVQRLAERSGVVLEPLGPRAEVAVARARVALVPYTYGTGVRHATATATAAGTPWVGLTASAAALDLGDSAPLFLRDDLPGVTQRALELLVDDAAWDTAAVAVAQRRRTGGRAALRRSLVHALAEVGIAPPTGSDLMPDLPDDVPGQPAPPPPAMVPVERRQPRLPTGEVARGWPGPRDADAQYALWLRENQPDLDAVARAVEALEEPPLISVVVPTWNSDPVVLGETLASVLAQVYPHWELCLADDASTSEATLEALRSWETRDDRVRVRRLDENVGISGATNAALALATGPFVALLDHDDLLKPHALARVALRLAEEPDLDLVYSDEDKLDDQGMLVEPFFKPDWSPEHLTSRNYIGHLVVARRSLVDEVGGFRDGVDGSQDHDLLLRLTERSERVAHIAEPLYTWRRVAGSTAAVVDAKPYAFEAAKRALDDALARRGLTGRAEDGLLPSTYRLKYDVVGHPRVAIVIPTRNGVHLLRRCIDSIREKSTFSDYSFLVIDNESDDPETLEYLATFGGRVLRYPHRFNYARMMNLASWAADADQLLFVNNDTEVVEPAWIEALLEHAQRPEVGAVGCRLLYPNDAPQHEGVTVNYAGGAAGNVNHQGWWGFGDVVRDCTAVTGAVTMMRPSVFFEVGGFEERLRVAFNDVDLCLRVRQAGYRVVYTPYATLYHHESATRGFVPHPEDDAFFDRRWEPRSERFRDPYYNPNLDRAYPFEIHSLEGRSCGR